MSQPRFLKAINRQPVDRPPIWFMRQAGRCLPEYRALRARAGDFMTMAQNPEMAAEITLQPMRRFAYDAAIVFADIVLLPNALGQRVWFETGEGPRLAQMPSLAALTDAIERSTEALGYVGETVSRVRSELEQDRAVIGFAGGPWTVATYMLMGRGGEDARAEAKQIALAEPDRVEALVDVIADATVPYLAMQVRAGADALQIFESWAEMLPEPALFERLVVRPHARIVQGLRALGITAPVIGFPRAAALELMEGYAAATGVQVVGLGTATPLELGRKLQAEAGVAIQGALDPELLLAGGEALAARVDELLQAWSGGPYVFNLGHGVMPATPVEHIAQVVEQVGAWRNA